MSTTLPRVIAWTPPGLADPAFVLACGRAGALGVLDLGGSFGVDAAVGAAEVVARHSDRPFGLRLNADALDWGLLGRLPTSLVALFLDVPEADGWPAAIALARRSGRLAVACVTSRGEAKAARGADARVLSGHEAGGRGAEESSFVLLQAAVADGGPPAWVRGGIGLRSAAGVVAAGAAGVVLDGALLLARESPLDARARERVARLDGGETVLVGTPPTRVHVPMGSPRTTSTIGWGRDQAYPIGQDAAFAASLASLYVTAGGIIQAVERSMVEGPRAARRLGPLAEDSPLAAAHGTRWPIVQGPMTRVSDTAAFAAAVADGGALPFLALAMLKGGEAATLLADVSARLGGKPWGVGILGFVPPELRAEQVAAIGRAKPPFALIAGGRPDQARELENLGISTYLHAPSPGLLRQYLADGSRRFVLEGRECGGHVGPRSSLVLWDQAGEVLGRAIDAGLDASSLSVLYAGGIHDRRSAAAVAAVAAPLADRGAKVGVLMGTAYLFTKEAVDAGAIGEGYQREALACDRTVLLETGPGHEVRVGPSPFAVSFEAQRRRLKAEGVGPAEARATLEALNTGRLRVATKGLDRGAGKGDPLIAVEPDQQRERGLYMWGQVAALRQEITTIDRLHREVCDQLRNGVEVAAKPHPPRPPSAVAIVGMSAIMPGAGDVRTLWENTLRGIDAITEVPADRWDWRLYYDADPKAPDKITSKWGGFVPDTHFDPLRYGMPPSSVPSIEPMQLLTLEAVRAALDDAGYATRPFDRERTAVVLGAGGGAAQLAMGYAFRSYLPMLDQALPGAGSALLEQVAPLLPEWTEDSFPGILLNVAAGRVANRFDLGGANYTVDAACGSSLAAASAAVRELESGAADMVILGGADTVQNPFTYLAFSKTHAFSPRGRCRPFDASADGIVISEGVAVVVLKRLADAERDGDRIYAVIRGIGASSDGRAKGLTAPRPEGQVRALERAYAQAGVSPSTVGYVEAHGTGTAAGDAAEVGALADVLDAAGARPGSVAVGSIKSQIGHTKCAAGLAGLINASLALYHKVLPPTIGVERPGTRFERPGSPLHISAEARPWLLAGDAPRRAGVSAFGFGGTNFHAVLEAYEGSPGPTPAPARDWPSELFLFAAADAPTLAADARRWVARIAGGSTASLRQLADFQSGLYAVSVEKSTSAGVRLAILATSTADLAAKLGDAVARLGPGTAFADPRGIDFAPVADGPPRVAFLFPGQGAQSPDMLRDLAVAFPSVREGFESFDAHLAAAGCDPVGPRIFPPPAFDEAGHEARRAALRPTEVAQPALGAASTAMLGLLRGLGVSAHAVAGHSYGELVALHAAGCLSASALAQLSEARGRLILGALGDERGAMAAIAVGPDGVGALIAGLDEVSAANWNGPSQTVIAGPTAGVAAAVDRARARGLRAQPLNTSCAFHSPLVADAAAPLADLASRLGLVAPSMPVYSNTTASPYPTDPAAVARALGEHLARPVRFAEMVGRMHADGIRVFVEVGPGSTLSPLVGAILADRPYLAVSTDRPGRGGVASLLSALGKLAVAGVPIDPRALTAGRAGGRVDPETLRDLDALPPPSPTTWLVNGTRARPIDGPEPRRLGVGPALPMAAAARHRFDPPQPAPRPPISGSRGQVVEAFQQTMRAFLDIQKSTMLDFLGSRSQVAEMPAPPAAADRPTSISADMPTSTRAQVPIPEAAQDIPALLLKIVQDRTGYPAEMLRLDLDLEADLGVDSIKRVEILGTLREAAPTLDLGGEGTLMDQLSRARTLGTIVELIGRRTPALVVAPPADEPATESRPSPVAAVRRLVLEAVDAPLPARSARLAPGGVVLITDDGRGVARAVAAELRSLGHPVVRVRHGLAEGHVEGVNLTSEAAVGALLDRVREIGPLAAIVHVMPLRSLPAANLDAEAWAARMGPEVRGLYLLARGAADDLAKSAQRGGSTLIAATGLGGAFASVGPPPGEFFPGHGGVAGLVKTLAREWPGVRARVVDLDPSADAEVLAADLVHEVLADDRRAEVGYRAGRRIALATRPSALESRSRPAVSIAPGEPIVVTGGARGITAAVALDLARRWRPNLLLIGSGPAPEAIEDPATTSLDTPAELKSALLDIARRAGQPHGPADVERAFRDLKRSREVRSNIDAIKHGGASVHYAQADVRDPAAMARVLGDWRRRFGPPAGLIHAAGVIRDKLLRDKSPESFDEVLGTKIDGALNLARAVDPTSLRFAAFFSSVAGRFGNRGQADYAAANEVLNKLAIDLDRRWPCRVVSIGWGPWSGVGMVAEIEAHLGRRGLGLIPPEAGRSRLGDELEHGAKGQVEVLIAGDLGSLESPDGGSDG